MKWSDPKAKSPDLASRALLRALAHLKGRSEVSIRQTAATVKGRCETTFGTRQELVEDLRLLRQLAERQTSELVTLTARLRLALDLLAKHGCLEEYLAEIGEEDGS